MLALIMYMDDYPPRPMTIEEFIALLIEELDERKLNKNDGDEHAEIIHYDFINKKYDFPKD
ncbi:MAG TPA: hypothetical protein EYG21_07930 [Nitrospinaceae bacterium]|nr:hypothetical protein [Nitrospinaceae bacterium]